MKQKFVIRYSVNLHEDYVVEAESEKEALEIIQDDFDNLLEGNLLEMDKSDEKFTIIK